MTTAYLTSDVKRDEGGFVQTAYPDPFSPLADQMRRHEVDRIPGWHNLSGAPWTIGAGHTGKEVHSGLVWTEDQCANALASDLMRTMQGLDSAIPWWRSIDDNRQDVLVNMAFNMGVDGLMEFHTTLKHVHNHEWALAAEGMRASLWAHQVGGRAERLIRQMETGRRS